MPRRRAAKWIPLFINADTSYSWCRCHRVVQTSVCLTFSRARRGEARLCRRLQRDASWFPRQSPWSRTPFLGSLRRAVVHHLPVASPAMQWPTDWPDGGRSGACAGRMAAACCTPHHGERASACSHANTYSAKAPFFVSGSEAIPFLPFRCADSWQGRSG